MSKKKQLHDEPLKEKNERFVSKEFNCNQIISILGLNSRQSFVVLKKYKNVVYTQQDWVKILKFDKII